MKDTPQQKLAEDTDLARGTSRIIKRFGGRHLIFRTQVDWRFFPRPYVLISSFRGPIWVFYGIGQIWLTHRKLRPIGGWLARTPRFRSEEVNKLVDILEPELTCFIQHCNEHGIEGSIVIEKKVIEFHWTFGFELTKEKEKPAATHEVEPRFETLVQKYLDAKTELGYED